ncbi:50S ribosomal protein L19 [Patescibacteria group bacterium]|nr:50S ribosomal protein L19 [Patescibacteria group bacterium]MBU1500586.1 50S ribosomal protein L19 [Patescibacteria group bacterium]MBU2080373.1 50S ribosomal protein L19 [Patescibacteria group bacterium]MBU2124215.1 50S ribosomal protein L19 [Patescibacteria group bacterium]MBU2194334.1 50S ribosomal protein L19 [Patescibacteria group bacterium]
MNAVITPVRTEERTKLGIRPGDTVRVHQKVVEKGKTRLQVFEGLVLAVKHGTEAGATFTVRATMSGVGVEKIFPLYSPVIDKIEIVRRSKVRRAKLYFIREKVAREVRRQLRNMRMVKLSTEDFKEEEKLEVSEEGSPVEEVVEATHEESPEVVAESNEGEVTPEEVAAEEVRKEEKEEQA